MAKKYIQLDSTIEVSEEDIVLVKMIADSMRPKQIAEKLEKSHRTIEARIAVLKKKYRVGTPSGLVMLFCRHDLIN